MKLFLRVFPELSFKFRWISFSIKFASDSLLEVSLPRISRTHSDFGSWMRRRHQSRPNEDTSGSLLNTVSTPNTPSKIHASLLTNSQSFILLSSCQQERKSYGRTFTVFSFRPSTSAPSELWSACPPPQWPETRKERRTAPELVLQRRKEMKGERSRRPLETW